MTSDKENEIRTILNAISKKYGLELLPMVCYQEEINYISSIKTIELIALLLDKVKRLENEKRNREE